MWGLHRGLTVALVALSLTSCHTVPFRSDGRDRDAAVLGLGGATPYLRTGTPAPRPAIAAPVPDARPAPGTDVYAATRTGLSPAVRGVPARVYVPDGPALDVLDPWTYRVVGHVRLGRAPRGVVPSWDLRTLWVTDGTGLTPIDPRTGLAGKPVKAAGDLSFTPDGRHALLLAPRRIELRTPRGMKPQGSIRVPCREPHDLDFAADGSFAVASCARRLVRVDPRGRRVTGLLDLGPRATPQDILLSPDGTVFYVADRAIGGVWLIDAATFRKAGFLGTGPGAHGLALSRDGSTLYVAGAGSVARIDTATRQVMGQWPVGGPDIGGVSDDGTVLWLTGDKSVEAVSTADGEVLRRLRGGTGLCFFPQPGRYSLGDTMR